MGQLSQRISRLIQSELNHRLYQNNPTQLSGADWVAGGPIADASVSQIDIPAGRTGYYPRTVPLRTAGAVTGAALYEAVRSLLEGEPEARTVVSQTPAAIANPAVDGVGVGGTALGVGLLWMAATQALAGLDLTSFAHLLQQGVDPEQILEQAIEEMQEELAGLRAAVIDEIACHKQTRQKYRQAQAEIDRWQQQAQLALQQGNKHLAVEALLRRTTHTNLAAMLKPQLAQQQTTVEDLKQTLVALKGQIAKAETDRNLLQEHLRIAQGYERLQQLGAGTDGLPYLLQQGIQLETLLELALQEMRKDLTKLRQAAMSELVSQKTLQQHIEQRQTEITSWHQRAQLALSNGQATLARQALMRKRMHAETVVTLKTKLNQRQLAVQGLKQTLLALQAQLAAAETHSKALSVKIRVVQVQASLRRAKIHSASNQAVAAFRPREDIVRPAETHSSEAADLPGEDLAAQFARLEARSHGDSDLAAMKAQLLSPPPHTQAKPCDDAAQVLKLLLKIQAAIAHWKT